MVHILCISMIFMANCHGGPIKNKVIDKLSLEALAADISTSDGSQALSSVQFRSKRSNKCCAFYSTPLPCELKIKSVNPVSYNPNIITKVCNFKNKQKYGEETLCKWNNAAKQCDTFLTISVKKGCIDCEDC